MPVLKHFFVLLLLLPLPVFSQKQNESVLTRKYAPQQLQEDAQIMKQVILRMHPVIGIYMPRAYYETLFDEFIRSLHDSLTEKQFRIRSKLVLDQLHCGHTEVLSSKAYIKAASKESPAFSPYLFMPLRNKVYVLASADRKRDTLLRKGTEITRINGIPTDSMVMFCRKLITSDGFNVTGKNHYLKLGFNTYFHAVFGRPDTFEVEYRNGKHVDTVKYASIHLKNLPPIPLMPKDDSLYVRHKKAGIRYRYLDKEKQTCVLKISSFSRRQFKRVYRKVFRELEKNQTENLVIDLRYNGGGSLENSYRLLSYLLKEPQTQTLWTGVNNYPKLRYVRGNIWFRLMRLGFTVIADRKKVNDTCYYVYKIKPVKRHHYDKQIFVLINGGTFSAASLVGTYLRQNRNAVFIGEETSGATEGCNAGITPYYRLPNTHVRVRVPAFRIVHDVSPHITGHGIIPDHRIDYSIYDLLMKRDLELDKVKELLNQKPAN